MCLSIFQHILSSRNDVMKKVSKLTIKDATIREENEELIVVEKTKVGENAYGLDEVLDKLEKEEDLKLTIDTKNDMDVHEIKEILKNYIDKEKINVSITVDTEY